MAIEGAVEAATQESSKEEIKTEAEEGAALSNSKSEEGQEEGAAAEETTPEENEIGSAAETNSVAASLPSPVSDRVGAPANSALYLEGTAEIMDPFFTRRATVRVKVRGVYALFSFKWDAGDEKDGVEDEFDGHQIFSSVSLVQFANLDQKKKGPILIEGHRVHCNYAFNQFRPYFFGVERDEAFFLQIEHRNRIVNGSMLAKEFVEQAAARLGRPPSSVAQICQMWQDKWLDTVKQLNECSEEEWASWNLPIPLFKEMQKMTDPGSNTVLVIDCCTCGECPLTGHVFISAQHFRKIQYQCPTCQAARRGNYQDFSPYDPVEDMLRVRFQAHLESALWAVNCALRKEQDAKGLARVVQILEFYVKQPSILTKSFIKNGLPKSQMPILEDTLRSVFQEDLKTRKEELGREVEQKKLEAAAAKSGKAPPKASAAAAANESKKPTLSQVGKKLANTVMTQLKEKAEQEAKEKGQEVAKKVGKVLLGVGKVVGKGLLGALFHVHL